MTVIEINFYTVFPKKWAPKHFATATANLLRFKGNFTYTRRHLFLSSMPNFIRIPYSVYEIFNSFKLLSQISVTDSPILLTSLLTSYVSSSPSSRRVPQPTVPMRRFRYCQLRHPTSSAHWIGHRTVQISIRCTMQFGAFCRKESTTARSVTSTIWKNDWLKSDVILIRTLLTEQGISGVIDCVHVYAQKGDTLIIWFEHVDCSD